MRSYTHAYSTRAFLIGEQGHTLDLGLGFVCVSFLCFSVYFLIIQKTCLVVH